MSLQHPSHACKKFPLLRLFGQCRKHHFNFKRRRNVGYQLCTVLATLESSASSGGVPLRRVVRKYKCRPYFIILSAKSLPVNVSEGKRNYYLDSPSHKAGCRRRLSRLLYKGSLAPGTWRTSECHYLFSFKQCLSSSRGKMKSCTLYK